MDWFLYDSDLRHESIKLHKMRKWKEAYAELPQISNMESLATIINCFYPLTIVTKHFILDVFRCTKYASERLCVYFMFCNL